MSARLTLRNISAADVHMAHILLCQVSSITWYIKNPRRAARSVQGIAHSLHRLFCAPCLFSLLWLGSPSSMQSSPRPPSSRGRLSARYPLAGSPRLHRSRTTQAPRTANPRRPSRGIVGPTARQTRRSSPSRPVGMVGSCSFVSCGWCWGCAPCTLTSLSRIRVRRL